MGHAIYFKLFAEYANALEVAGAWGWVLRTRRDHRWGVVAAAKRQASADEHNVVEARVDVLLEVAAHPAGVGAA